MLTKKCGYTDTVLQKKKRKKKRFPFFMSPFLVLHLTFRHPKKEKSTFRVTPNEIAHTRTQTTKYNELYDIFFVMEVKLPWIKIKLHTKPKIYLRCPTGYIC